MLAVGALSAFCLGLTNISLDKYVKRNPTSFLARDMNDGCNRQVYHYLVPMLSMTFGLALCALELITRESQRGQSWWFGVQRQWAATWALGLGAGHYAQEIVANQWCGSVLFMHHIAAVACAFCLEAASSWSGLLFTWSGVYEAGSLLLCLGYTGGVSRKTGHWAATVSSVVGLLIGVHGFIVQWPQLCELNGAAWFVVVALFLLGVGRIQDGVENLLDLRKQEQLERKAA
mmetsp:Transcript_86098/g.221752  ORF Transcript_86098/g.221752 Transcript_86098/m.221752 type:complete len:231 (-) Transcript_86098:50-742(-)